MTKRYFLTDYDERVLASFSTTKDVENTTVHSQICMVYGYTSDDCMIIEADDDAQEFENIDEYIDLY